MQRYNTHKISDAPPVTETKMLIGVVHSLSLACHYIVFPQGWFMTPLP